MEYSCYLFDQTSFKLRQVHCYQQMYQHTIIVYFVGVLIQKGLVRRGDIYVVDNCSIHMKGNNGHLQDHLLHQLGVLMVPLPPTGASSIQLSLSLRCLWHV